MRPGGQKRGGTGGNFLEKGLGASVPVQDSSGGIPSEGRLSCALRKAAPLFPGLVAQITFPINGARTIRCHGPKANKKKPPNLALCLRPYRKINSWT